MEKEIYEKLVAGDTSVFEQVFKETYKDAYLLAFSFMKRQEDAEDVLQESYIKMFNNISKLQDTDKFKSWFNQIIVNNCKNSLKKSNRYALNFSDINDEDTDTDFEDSLVNEDETLNLEDVIDKTEITKIMAGIINSLPEEQSLCLQMFYYQDMKINDIASVLDISENTVKSRLRIAKNKVSAKVEEIEKKNNIKLHSISLIPLFFKISVDNSDFPQLDFSKTVLPSLAAGTAGASLAGTSTASSAITSAHTTAGVATTIASTTAKTVAVAATKKIIAVAVATAVTVSGVGVGAKQIVKKVHQKSNAESTSVTQTVEATNSVEDKEAVEKEIEKYSVTDYKTNVMPSAAVKYKDYIYYSNWSVTEQINQKAKSEYSFCRKDSNGNIEVLSDKICTSMLILYNKYLFFADSNDKCLYMVNLDEDFKPEKINKGTLTCGDYDGMYVGDMLLDYKLMNGKVYYIAIANGQPNIYAFDVNNKKTTIVKNSSINTYISQEGLYYIYNVDENYKSSRTFYSENNEKLYKTDDSAYKSQSVYEDDKYIVFYDVGTLGHNIYYLINKQSQTKTELISEQNGVNNHYSNINIIDDTLYAFSNQMSISVEEENSAYKNVEIKL